jgi:hypothetical protein
VQKTNTEFVGFKVFTALIMKNTIFWDVIPWNFDYKALHLRRQYSSNTELFLLLKCGKKKDVISHIISIISH